ncbi:hypothetical protein G5I_02612 [Acromyrmex echinatior]|uniref:Uncharacterized protein n=1 Tax=Acromyrmex echinatior TaxID=103372 RepID=F4WAS0_ACREC|nr:hypothetical protein G5I_02612 [Acromyrmex echinatior]
MHKEAGTPPGQATPRDPAAKRWGYRASAGRGIRQRERRIVQLRVLTVALGHLLPACLPRAGNAAGLKQLSNSRDIRRTSGNNVSIECVLWSDCVVAKTARRFGAGSSDERRTFGATREREDWPRASRARRSIHDSSMKRRKKLPSVRASHLVGDGLEGSVRFNLYGLLAELTRSMDHRPAGETTSSTAVVVPSATSRLTTHLSAFRRDFEEEEEEEEEEEKEEDPQKRVQRRSFQPVVRPDPNRRRTTTAASSTECESDEECGELISTESEGCHGESRPDRVVLISRRILSRGLC